MPHQHFSRSSSYVALESLVTRARIELTASFIVLVLKNFIALISPALHRFFILSGLCELSVSPKLYLIKSGDPFGKSPLGETISSSH